MIETVRELISTDPRITLLMTEEEFETFGETIRIILVEDFGKREICARFVQHCLADEQKVLRLPACQEFIPSVDEDLSCLTQP
jgi:hypothetical protein